MAGLPAREFLRLPFGCRFAFTLLVTDEEMINSTVPERQIDRLRAIMHRLRGPGGCPWDAEQSHASLISNLIEETYELVEAIQHENSAEVLEELGDLLFQIIFQFTDMLVSSMY